MSTADVLEPEIAPPVGDDDRFYEIVDGLPVEQPPMGASETFMAYELAKAIDQFTEPARLGRAVPEMLFRLRAEPSLQRRPDAAFVSSGRWPIGRKIPKGNAWEVVPDLAIEIVSPTNLANEIPAKVREYFEAGVRRVWVLYPDESLVYDYDSPLTIRAQRWGDPIDGGEVIPGLQIVLSELLGAAEEASPA
jgi:Uma2 family endonuclease